MRNSAEIQDFRIIFINIKIFFYYHNVVFHEWYVYVEICLYL